MDKCTACDGRGSWPVDIEKLKKEDPEQFEFIKSFLTKDWGPGATAGPPMESCVYCNETGSEKMRIKLEESRSSPLLHEYETDICPDVDECRWCGERKAEHKSDV